MSFALLLPFDTDSGRFARGFECGRIWARLVADPDEPVEEVAHADQAEMLLRMAESAGRRVETERMDDNWVMARFAAAEAEVE